MNKFNRLYWESNFFEFEVGFIKNPIKNISLKSLNYKLIVVNQDIDKLFMINDYEEKYKECRIVYSKNISKIKIIENIPLDYDQNPKSIDSFKELAYESGKFSRFFLDKNFGEKKFRDLYDKWIENSLNKSFADKIFFYEENEKIISFVTLKIDENKAKIGLIATDSNFQGKGYGKRLINFVEYFCNNLKIEQLDIPTQQENKGACMFYEKLKFNITEKYYIKHYWKI